VDEAVWGSRFLQKMIVRDSYGKDRVLCGIFSTNKEGEYDRFGYWNIPSIETDNIINTGDERKVGSLWNVSGMADYSNHPYGFQFTNKGAAMMVAAALANTANIQHKWHYWDGLDYFPNNLSKNAYNLFMAHKDDVFYGNDSLRENIDKREAWSSLFAIYALAKWFNSSRNYSTYLFLINYGNKIREAFLNASAGYPSLMAVKNAALLVGSI